MDPLRWPSVFPTIETSRLLLRKLTPRDVSDTFAYSSDPEVVRYLRFSEHKSLHDAEEFLGILLKSYDNSTDLIWGVELRSAGDLIGSCRLKADLQHRRCEIGYVITRQYWRQGFAFEAVSGIVDFTFRETDINRIEGYCIVENIPSSAVLKKCGFSLEGVLRQREFLKGRFLDINLYSLLRGDQSISISAK